MSLSVASLLLLLLVPASQLADDLPAEPRKALVDAAKQFRKAKTSKLTWKYTLGTSKRADHIHDHVAFMQEHEIEIRDELMFIPHMKLFRTPRRGAFLWEEQWRPLMSHIVGRWFMILLDYPENLFADAAKGAAAWVTPRKGGETKGAGNRVVRCRLSRKAADAHFANVVKSGCVAGRGESLSSFLSRVDNTRVQGHIDVEIRDGKPKRILLVVLVGRTGERDSKKPLEEQEHVLVRSEFIVHSIDDLGPIEVPEGARKILEKK